MNGSLDRAVHDTGTTVNAFTRIHDDRMLTLYRTGNEHIGLTCSSTPVAAYAFFLIICHWYRAAGDR